MVKRTFETFDGSLKAVESRQVSHLGRDMSVYLTPPWGPAAHWVNLRLLTSISAFMLA